MLPRTWINYRYPRQLLSVRGQSGLRDIIRPDRWCMPLLNEENETLPQSPFSRNDRRRRLIGHILPVGNHMRFFRKSSKLPLGAGTRRHSVVLVHLVGGATPFQTQSSRDIASNNASIKIRCVIELETVIHPAARNSFEQARGSFLIGMGENEVPRRRRLSCT